MHVQIAISDSVFKGLDNVLEEMAALKDEREGQLADFSEVLNNMWRMLEIAETDENRQFYEKMMHAPARLHSHSLEKVWSLEHCPVTLVLVAACRGTYAMIFAT